MKIIAKGEAFFNVDCLSILCKDGSDIIINLEEPIIKDNEMYCENAYLIGLDEIDIDNEVQYLFEYGKEIVIEMEGPFIDTISFEEDGFVLEGNKEELEDGSEHVYLATETKKELSILDNENKTETNKEIEEEYIETEIIEFSEESLMYEDAIKIMNLQLEDMRQNKWPTRENPEKKLDARNQNLTL